MLFYTTILIETICTLIVSLFETAVDVDECESNPCEADRRCVDDVNGYTCQCADGYAGDDCQGDTNFNMSLGTKQ